MIIVQTAAGKLLEQLGITAPFDLHDIKRGGNNRVFRVALPDRNLLLKVYFQHARDKRPRLDAEYGFSTFAWQHGLRCLPQPLAVDTDLQAALFEFVEGEPIQAGQVDADAVNQAAAFYDAVNQHRDDPAAERLPVASEACFSIQEHLQCVARRVERLRSLRHDTFEDQQACAVVQQRLFPAWDEIREHTIAGFRKDPDVFQLGLTRTEQRLSPSDFGFHNAFRRPDGSFCFFDFEYAGWDDPAKTLCDFFCQVAIPVPLEHLAAFTERVTADMPEAETVRERVRLLLPVYQMKWCCIVLNDFLPTDGDRRRFAQDHLDVGVRKRAQLAKLERLLDNLLTKDEVPL